MKKLLVFGVSLALFLVLSLSLVSSQNISVNYPHEINCKEEFDFEVELKNFSQDVYDVKIDITEERKKSEEKETEKEEEEEIQKPQELKILDGSQNSERIQRLEQVGKEEKIINLGGKDIKTKQVYKSKTQYIKEYAIYGFALFCVFVIIILIIKK